MKNDLPWYHSFGQYTLFYDDGTIKMAKFTKERVIMTLLIYFEE
jgi:hypothetical protein